MKCMLTKWESMEERVADEEKHAEEAKKTADQAGEKAEGADRRSKIAFFDAHDGRGNCAEAYFKNIIGEALTHTLSISEEEVRREVEEIWERVKKEKKGPLTLVKEVELVNRILGESNLDISFELLKATAGTEYELFKNLPEDIITN